MSRTRRLKKAQQRAVREVGQARSVPADPFGLEREQVIAASSVRAVFTPHQPVSQSTLLFGRTEEVRGLVETLNTPGQHVLLYGDRGVGKSSLANVVADVVRVAMGRTVYRKRCDSQDTFETIVQAPLKAVGADLTLTGLSTTDNIRMSGALRGGPLSAGGESSQEVLATYTATGSLSPSTVAQALRNLDALLVVDEADAIASGDDRRKLAELIKHLSDEGSAFKIMVVGIAATGGELTAAHPSVQRCLRETKLRRMRDAELEEIVTSGASALKLNFATEVTHSIVRLSAGYPHFTHLLALKCAEEAITRGRHEIRHEHLRDAMQLALTDAEGTLRRVYADSVRSASDMYRVILVAAASLTDEEFGSSELRDAIESRTSEPISQGSLNNYFQRLVSRDGTTILRRTGQGYYRFEDPRMPSYVRIANGMA